MTKSLKNVGTSVRTKVLQLSPQFVGGAGKAKQWSAFASKAGARDIGDFEVVMEHVARFLTRPHKRARTSAPWKTTWPKGGLWSS